MKKLILLGIALTGLNLLAAEPMVVIRSEKFGRAMAELIDCGGMRYKFYLPTTGTVKCVTLTGWYLIDSTGKIIEFQDSKR